MVGTYLSITINNKKKKKIESILAVKKLLTEKKEINQYLIIIDVNQLDSFFRSESNNKYLLQLSTHIFLNEFYGKGAPVNG